MTKIKMEVIKIELNIEAVQELIKEKFRNKLTYLADELEIDYSYLNQIMHKRRPATSKKVCNRIIKYCIENGLDYRKYIIVLFEKKIDTTNLSTLMSSNNQIKNCIKKAQIQINEAQKYVDFIDELIRKVSDELIENL